MSSIYAELKVITNSGIVNGYKKNNAIYWDDIPYAKPPINELRWRAPRPIDQSEVCLLYTSPSPRDISGSRMPSSA